MSLTERIGRYVLYPPIAAGGMATVHTARIATDGMHRLVAAKRLHPQLSEDPEFVSMFHDEARIASRIHHPNVVPVLDVVTSGNELILVQEYVHGVPLSHLLKQANANEEPIPIHITIAIVTGVLAGLHAAHEVKDDDGKPLEIVHRDVSPQNILVSVDGVPRLLDFGIAKARTSTHHTREGVFKGKLAYMAPEQLKMDPIERTIDVYAMGVLLWELLVNRRIFDGRHELGFVTAVMCGEIPKVLAALFDTRETVPEVRLDALATLEPIVTKAMSGEPRDRYPTADAMMRAIAETDVPSASVREVAAWVKRAGADYLDRREKTLAENEGSWRTTSVRATTVSRGVVPPLPIATPASAVRPSPLPLKGSLPRPTPPPRPTPHRATPLPRPSPLSPLAISEPPPPPSLSPIVTPAPVRQKRARDLSRVAPWLIVAALFIVTGLVAGITTASRPTTSASFAPAAPPPPPPPTFTAQPDPTPFLQLPVPTVAPAVITTPARTHYAPPPPPAPQPRWVAPPPPPAKPSATADCNPPFFFEGTKKVFKPACL